MKREAKFLTDISKGKVNALQSNRLSQRLEIASLHRCNIPSPRIAWFSDCHLRTVGRWLIRIACGEPIADRPRSGRPPLYGERTHLKTIAFFCQTPPLPGYSRWSFRDAEGYLRRHPEVIGCGMSHATIGRILAEHTLRPLLKRYFLQITDPEFFPKMEHIINLYLNPPEYLFCFDECTGIQAIERLAPDFPTCPAHPFAREFQYRRHGTTDLMAFLRPSNGDVFCRCTENHNTQTLARVFTEHVRLQPEHAFLHYICDNLNTHFHDDFCATVAELSGIIYTPLKTGMERRQWLQSGDKRITIHFVPFHGSWLNMIEIWFGILGNKCLKNGWFGSVEALIQAIDDFALTWGEHFAHPFTWTYRGEGLHGKAVRRFMRLLQMESLQMDIRFLTKQLLLMGNMVRDYWIQVGKDDWQQLLYLMNQKQSYLTSIIARGSKESTPRGGGFRDRPLKEAKFLLIVLFAPLILFLILHVAPNLVFIQTNGTDAVAAAPEMIAPVRLALQRRIALENLYRCLTLQYAHNFRN